VLATAFEELPSKKQYPDYYDIVRKPTCLSNVDKVGSRRLARLARFDWFYWCSGSIRGATAWTV
jgi:hypothetical protein